MTKEQFFERIERCFITKDEYMKDLQQLIDKGAITDADIAKMEDNFLPIYAIAAAIYKSETDWLLYGASEPNTNRSVSRKANYYKSFIK